MLRRLFFLVICMLHVRGSLTELNDHQITEAFREFLNVYRIDNKPPPGLPMQFLRAQYRPPMPAMPMTMYPPPLTPVVQWTNSNGQMPNWFGPFMMSLMNFRRDILERMNIGQVAVSQPQAYHLETDDPEDGFHSAEDSSEEETDKHHGTFTNGPLPYGANLFGQSPYTPQPAFGLTPFGPQQPFGSAPYGPQQSYGLAPYQPYGSLGPMPYGDYVPSHPKKVNHKKKKYHAHAEPEPEPYHAHETEYSHEDSSEEESGEFRNRKGRDFETSIIGEKGDEERVDIDFDEQKEDSDDEKSDQYKVDDENLDIDYDEDKNEKGQSNEDYDGDKDEKERQSNEDSAADDQEDAGSGDKDDLRDYDPETISEKIDELRHKNGKDYLDEVSPPQTKNKTVSNADNQEEKLNIDNKKLKEKKVKKIAKTKKTLSTVNVRKPDEPEAKSLADLDKRTAEESRRF